MSGEKPSESAVIDVDIIEADAITVEVVDKHTGRLFRRELPVRYRETANGVVLEGETPTGEPARLSFLSAVALARLGDLFGKGPDAPRCRHQEED